MYYVAIYIVEDACLLFQIGDVSRNFLPSTSINPEYEILAENKSEEVQSSTNKVQLSYSRFDVAEVCIVISYYFLFLFILFNILY